jgi:hypothetical protein
MIMTGIFLLKNIKYFGGFKNEGKTGAGANTVLISDNLTIANGLKANETEITKIKTSSSAKEELLSSHPGNLIFLSPVYFSGSQPASSYFECFSDSASSPELNLRVGEAADLTFKIFIRFKLYKR